MKRYNISPVKRTFDWGEMTVVALGERGRGRFENVIPFHADEQTELLEIGLTKTNKPKIVQSADGNGWLAVVSGDGCYTRGTYGTVYCLKGDEKKIKVISYGCGAYGDAGRIGDWNEFLITVNYPIFLRVRPSGGSHKIARYWLYFGDDKVYKIQLEELPIFCEQFGLDIPEEGNEGENLIDLISLKEK